MAHPVWDTSRGTWSVRWNNGSRQISKTLTRRPPGYKEGTPRPAKVPPHVLEFAAARTREELSRRYALQGRTGLTVRLLLDGRLANREANAQPASLKVMRPLFASFIQWCESEEIYEAAQVTPAVAARWVADRSRETSYKTKRKRSAGAVVRDMGLLSAAWERAVLLEQVDRNPWKAVERPSRPPRVPGGSWSPEEFQRLLAVSRPWLRAVLTIGCNTGLRIEALRGLEWRDVQFAKEGEKGRGVITVRPELDKAHKGYSLPMSAAAHAILRTLHRERNPAVPFILLGQRGRPITESKTTARAIARACERAGLPFPTSPNHHMRRSFGRWAVLGQLTGKPVPLYIVSRWLGHASVKMTEYYLDVKMDVSQEWMEPDEPNEPGGSDGPAEPTS